MATVGRPLKFKTVEELESKINQYFTDIPLDEWTWTGLALFLDTDKWTLTNYRDKTDENGEEFSAPIKKALLMVENQYELDLKKHGRTGTIFALKNFDWKDKTETDITSNGETVGQADPIVAAEFAAFMKQSTEQTEEE